MVDVAADSFDIEPFFLDSPRGSLFCLYLAPRGREPVGKILYLHPFAEEMHKSRRMAALQARAFAALGYAVLQFDLTGCGDSAGDFGDASWEAWKDDIRLAHAWLEKQCHGSTTLWGLRIGAALAVEMGGELAGIDRLILWQPVVSGELFLTQFLRIKLASEMLSAGQAQSGTKALRAQLEAGAAIEVGGYMLAPAMARALASWKLANYTCPTCPVCWMEIGATGDFPPASQRVADTWREAGALLVTHAVVGEPFWVTQEITECFPLIDATLSELA